MLGPLIVAGGLLLVTATFAFFAGSILRAGLEKILPSGERKPKPQKDAPLGDFDGPLVLASDRSLVAVDNRAPKDIFFEEIEKLIHQYMTDDLRPAVDQLLNDIWSREQYRVDKEPWKISKEDYVEFAEKIGVSIACVLLDLPKVPASHSAFKVPLLDAVENPFNTLGQFNSIFHFYHQRWKTGDPMAPILQTPDRRLVPSLYHNLAARVESGVREKVDPRQHLMEVGFTRGRPPRLDAEPWELAEAYFHGTPFYKFLSAPVPMNVPNELWYEHCHVVAPPGTGKTNLLQFLMAQRFDEVAGGKASVVVMDSNYDLINSIRTLARFGPGGDLQGRLVLIDAEDVDYPLALNLFDIGLAQIRDSRSKERVLNAAIASLTYTFRALLQMELTGRQSAVFNFTMRLMIVIPQATLDTLIDVMKNGTGKYERYLSQLDKDALLFFSEKFEDKNDKFMKDTRAQIVDRIFAVKATARTISRMFDAPRTKLDLFKEMGGGKVILVNAPSSFLQAEGVELFGRFFLSQILLAAEKRQLLPPSERLPTYIFIDEAQDIVWRDEKLPDMLDQARKLKVSVTVAHQRIDQMQPAVLSALNGSTAIKFAARSPLSDASALAPSMSTTAGFITKQKEHHFAAFLRGVTATAISLNIPKMDFQSEPKMEDTEYRVVVREMRQKFAIGGADDEPDIEEEHQEQKLLPAPTSAKQVAAKLLGFRKKDDPDAPSEW